MQQLSGQDAMFIYLETPRTPNHVGGFMTYDPSTAPGGKVSFDDLLTHVEARVPLLPMLRRRLLRVPLDLDHPYWVDDPGFDLEYHVRQIALPRPGDWKQLRTQAARLLGRPLDPARPLWEIYHVEGLDKIDGLPEGSFAIVLKLHHAAVDGVAGRGAQRPAAHADAGAGQSRRQRPLGTGTAAVADGARQPDRPQLPRPTGTHGGGVVSHRSRPHANSEGIAIG